MKLITILILALCLIGNIVFSQDIKIFNDSINVKSFKYYKGNLIRIDCSTAFLINQNTRDIYFGIFSYSEKSRKLLEIKELRINTLENDYTNLTTLHEELISEHDQLIIRSKTIIDSTQTQLAITQTKLDNATAELVNARDTLISANLKLSDISHETFKAKLRVGFGCLAVGFLAGILLIH